MNRLINADALKKRKFQGESEYTTGWNDALDAVARFEPTVDAEPVRHGKWEPLTFTNASNEEYTMHRCSECGLTIVPGWYHYCPNCGARMDEE